MKRDPKMSIGQRVALARDTYKLNQAQLAANLGVTRAAISQYEQDKIRPRSRIIDRLAEVFNADPDWFERGRGKAPDPLDAPLSITEINLARLTVDIADPRHLSSGRRWQLPTEMLPEAEVATEHLVAILAPNNAAPIHAGDRVVIDIRRCEIADAVFLLVDAGGPKLRRCKTEADNHTRIIGRAVAYFRAL